MQGVGALVYELGADEPPGNITAFQARFDMQLDTKNAT